MSLSNLGFFQKVFLYAKMYLEKALEKSSEN
jgi:hypothetical protein